MAERLSGKRAFVTGAGQGMGRAIALAFSAEGCEVIAASRTLEKMEDLPQQSALISTVGVDVTDGASLENTLKEAGALDILVNCAGWVHDDTLLNCTDEEWQRSLDVNVTSAFRAIKAVLPGMIERGRGAIVNVASVASSISGVNRRVAYGASKAALIGLSKGVAREVITTGVRCNALCPGTTDSPSLGDRMRSSGDAEAARNAFIARQPMGRLGTVEEMAAAAVYLASDETAFMTGQTLVIDGGQTL
ncbi:SDR family oxidoreductase [Nitratireductor basaltis]|uniref:Short-chain dehydrogenase/reductase SDR n=1 Tax=Nitratireductor basaltis TaxID=472175 RepID=A0A084U8U1_9HYPH|nr:SDR family oxidoreductase [Nitratireductor basaltis]KFB09377.1 Short-chain dehydrogenase/reductase SDR [Nitratireductor basaltis]